MIGAEMTLPKEDHLLSLHHERFRQGHHLLCGTKRCPASLLFQPIPTARRAFRSGLFPKLIKKGWETQRETITFTVISGKNSGGAGVGWGWEDARVFSFTFTLIH